MFDIVQQPTEFLKFLASTFSGVLSSNVGCFLPDVVSNVRFICEPKRMRLPQRMFSGRECELVRGQLLQWLEQGIIREVTSAPLIISPIVLAPKGNASFRLCVDFRYLNSMCVQDFCPVTDRVSLLRNIRASYVMSTIDVSNAYLCLRLHPSIQPYFGVCFDFKYFIFQRCPFGFCNSGHFFVMAMHYTISHAIKEFSQDSHIYVYVDDILIMSNGIESHKRALVSVFRALDRDGWSVCLSKCDFFKTSVRFLGCLIDRSGFVPSLDVIRKLKELPRPKTRQELRTFYGLCNVLAPHNHKMQEILGKINNFKKADVEAFQTKIFNQAWDETLELLTRDIWQLKFFDPEDKTPMNLFVDSSHLAHSGVLFQRKKLIAMFSTRNEKPYMSSGASEITGLIKCLRSFRPFLVGVRVNVFTDNKAILDAINVSNQSDFVCRVMEEILCWFGTGLKFFHVPGAKNILADFLSRNTSLIRSAQWQRADKIQGVAVGDEESKMRL